jgi:hypothetical protein
VEYGLTLSYGNSTRSPGRTQASIPVIGRVVKAPVLSSVSPDRATPGTVSTLSGTVVAGQTVTLNAPLNPILPLISNIAVGGITVSSATITWRTDQLTDSLVSYGTTASYGSSVADSTLTTSHTIRLNNLAPSRTYHFRVSSKNSYGISSSSGDNSFTTSAPITPITLSITSPVDNGTVAKSGILVEGRVANGSGNETGVVVNGVVANIYAGEFVANHVPLAEGANVITATATDVAGNTATATINLNSVKVANYIEITANSEVGLSPLEIVLTLGSSLPLTNGSLTYTGPGEVELLSSSSNQYKVRMTTEGIYHYIATVTDAGGTVYEDTIAIIALSKTELENRLVSKWEGMKGALLSGNMEVALSFFVPGAQGQFRQVFEELGSDGINSLFSSITGVELDTASGRAAEGGLIRDEDAKTYSYPITFVQDQNGIWKIMGF